MQEHNKYKFILEQGMEGPEGEQRHSCTLSVILGLEGAGGKSHNLAAVLPGKRPGTNHNTINISVKHCLIVM